MNFYIKNIDINTDGKHTYFDEKEYLKQDEAIKIQEFIKSKKHAMGYIDEKYDDFVLLIFPTRHDIIHFEIHHKLKTAVLGIVIKTEEAYEEISQNIDDKDTHLDFLKTPTPPAETVEIQDDFKNYYLENKKDMDELFMILGSVIYDIKM